MSNTIKEFEIKNIINEELKKYYKVLLEGDVSSVQHLSGQTLEELINASESISKVSSKINEMIMVMQKSENIQDPESVEYLSSISKDVSAMTTKLSKLRENFAEIQTKLQKHGTSDVTPSDDEGDLDSGSFSPEIEAQDVKLHDPKHGQEILNDEENL